MAQVYDENNSDKWKNKVSEIFNNDDLLIMYKWKYNTNNTWRIEILNEFKQFCFKNKIKICESYNDIIQNLDSNYECFVFNKNDEYMINNKLLSTHMYHENPRGIIYFDPNKILKKIYCRACSINSSNFFSFPVGIYERDIFSQRLIKHTRIRTPESIKTIILNNYLTSNKQIKNYIYFLQTFNDENQEKNNPLYFNICNNSKNSQIITHTTNQHEHWSNLNNHLFCLCLSWNTLESPRLWESLYFGCIPIIIDYYESNNFIENNYNDLPILHIKNIDDLFSESFIKEKYISIISNVDNYNFDKITMSYWLDILKR